MNRFTLVRLPTLAAASERVAKAPQTRVFRAGGIDLIDLMKEGIDGPDELVELRAVGGDDGARMHGIRETDGRWSIGALTTLGEIAEHADLGAGAFAALGLAAGSAATPGIRNAATLGGNLLQRPRCWYFRHVDLVCLKKGGAQCYALTGDNRYHAIFAGGPSFIVHASTMAVALLALDAKVVVRGPKAPRELGIAELFQLPTVDATREHTLKDGEVVVALELPPAGADQRSIYAAVKENQSHDWPLGEVAVRARLAGGKLADVRVALGHVAPVPWRAKAAEAALEGQAPSAELFAKAAEAALEGAKALDHNAYKIPLCKGLMREALHRLCGVPLPE
ncbi:MAG TPA: FAD binding domain-containing protein [Nannocystaceae bacterium]|nr:FAD binding domain-containing protein [Nannocystaceae bacterium]